MYKFAKAFNKVLAKQWEKHRSNSDDIWARSFEDALDSDVSIDFFRTVLLDGIAGAGKT
jgi:hypothetical protein